MLVVQLFFGLDRGGQPISPKEWAAFLEETVTVNFPDGFTVYDAFGQWLNPKTHSISHEPTKVVEIATEEASSAYARIEAVSQVYRRDFSQQSVGVITNQACGAF